MKTDVKITPRLKMAANLTKRCEIVADIGTDHAYLPVFLVQNGICEKAVAADVNKGPLVAARKHIAEAGLTDKIEIKESDGLKSIDRADIVTICGMGGELIAKILEHRKPCMKEFVLQPQRKYDFLRDFLAQNGFEIKKEAIAKEREKMYCAFYAEYTGKCVILTRKEALLGRKELFDDEDLYNEYVAYRRNETEKALKQMEKAGFEGERYEYLKELSEVYR